MATRIDHSNCTHPRTPAGRSACRRETYLRDAGIDTSGCLDEGNRGVAIVKDEWTPATVSAPLTREQLMAGMTTKEKARFAAQMASDAARARGRMAKRGRAPREVTITDVTKLPMPKLTPAQLASPIYRSMLRTQEV